MSGACILGDHDRCPGVAQRLVAGDRVPVDCDCHCHEEGGSE